MQRPLPDGEIGGAEVSLDHLVCGRQERLWDGKAERLGGLEVDHQIETRRLLHGQFGRSSPFIAAAFAPRGTAPLM